MTADSLLLWMSARGSGSWQQFRAAVEEMNLDSDDLVPEESDDPGAYGLPLYQLLRLNLQRLGHAEFFGGANGADWRIVPPVLAISGRGTDSLGVLVGARSPASLRRLDEAKGATLLESCSADGYPTQVRIRAGVPDLVALADRARVLVQPDAPLAILLSLPPVDEISTFRHSDLPFGTSWTVERFSTSTLGWKPAARIDATGARAGLFRFSFRHERRVFYCAREGARELGAQTGKYILLKRVHRRVFEYDPGTRTVAVRPSCRPPFVIERALILCSGLPPQYDRTTGRLAYTEVPNEIGRLASQLLRQDF